LKNWILNIGDTDRFFEVSIAAGLQRIPVIRFIAIR
jgi:hypothetical protein